MSIENPDSNQASPEDTSAEPDPREKYVIEDETHELVEKFKPQYIGHGGEHIVYAVPDHPDVVAKAATAPMARLIEHNVETGNAPDELGEDTRARAEAFLQKEAQRFATMREHFGKEHTLPQRKYLLKVPVTLKILNEVFEGEPPASPSEAWTTVTIQKKSEALQDENRVDAHSLVAGYAEMQEDLDQDAYKRQTEQLFVNPHEPSEFNESEFLAVQNNDALAELVQKSDTDPDLQETLKDFVRRSVRYTNETGETLDLAGNDNVALYQKDGKWNYELLDALYPGKADMVEETQAALKKLAAKEEIDDGERNGMMNTINYVRTVNGLAKKLGEKEFIDIVPPETKGADIDYQQEIQKHLKGLST